MAFDLGDYVDVAERIAEFRVKHPEGSLQSEVLRWPDEGFPFVAVQATAYRSATDVTPGKGLAWENFPGRTPYTKDSELQNAETSAWGRAIVAVLAADTKRGVASRQEVSRASGAPSSAPESTSVGDSAGQARETGPPTEVRDGVTAPTDQPSGSGAGEAGTAPEEYGEGSDGAVPSTTDLATADDLADAAKHGLTPTKTKAIAASLGITVAKATDLTREQLAAVINRYLEVKK